MRKVMLINVTHVEESRVAILEDGVLAGYEIETTNRGNIIGNIYNVVIETAIPSIEAAFAKLGPDLKGFLPLDEVNFRLLPARGDGRGKGKIVQHLHSGQRLMAQVIRAPFGGKPPTITTYFSLPGRYLVLMPGVDASGISRKIADSDQRERLKKIVDELSPPEGFGLIVRTAGVGRTKTELQRDLRYLLRLWESVQRASQITEFPGLVYQERDLVIRTIRDYLTPDIREVWIDSKETYERALAFVRDVMPARAKTLQLYTGERPLFNRFNVEEQIESIYQRRVTLPSGGEIVIDGTEALTAVDVNSARSARKGDAEETALQTNLEAATEIARQLRLRDLGGLVVVDFIDLASTRNRGKVEKTMRDAMKTDKARYDVTRISKLGLMELARQRLKGAKMSASYKTCPACEGHGLVRTVESAALAALRKLQTRSLRSDVGRVRVLLPGEVAAWMLNHKREELLQLERRHDVRVSVEAKAGLLMHQCEFETAVREKAEAPPALVGPDRPSPPVPPDLAVLRAAAESERATAAPERRDEPEAAETAPAGRKRRRRRRRRGGAGAQAGLASGGEAATEVSVAPATGENGGEETAASEPPEAAGAVEAASGEDRPAESAGTGEGSRRRRRRRRRRRGGGPQASTPTPEEPRGGGGEDSGDEPVVPSGVRPEELMPAATGGNTGGAGFWRAVGRGKRRRRGGRRGQPAGQGGFREE